VDIGRHGSGEILWQLVGASFMSTEKQLSSPKTSDYPSPRMLELLDALEKRGLLEAATGVLNDEATFSELMALFSSDDALSIIQNAKPIIKLLSTVDYNAITKLAQAVATEKQSVTGAISLVRLVSALESRGLIEPIVGLLQDEKTVANLAKILSSDDSLTILNNLHNLTKLTNIFDPEVVDILNKAAASLKTEVEPVKGILAVAHQLGDHSVARGMGKLFQILRVLGGDAETEEES
jgi:uncharacterized protein YjgD (DUF1641 family)